jgi:hypothetical protein
MQLFKKSAFMVPTLEEGLHLLQKLNRTLPDLSTHSPVPDVIEID